MKVYMSVDIEGCCGVTDWSEVVKGSGEYEVARKQMTNEVIAACQGAFEAGASEIMVNDSHGDARNIVLADLPMGVKLIRGWGGHPYGMMQTLDKSFKATMMVGYHSKGCTNGNPLAHTISSRKVNQIIINEVVASEFLLNMYTSFLENVPVIFISGDEMICQEAHDFLPNIRTAAVKQGVGGSTINIHSNHATTIIHQGAKDALLNIKSHQPGEMPEFFEVKIEYMDFKDAFSASFYPGVRYLSAKTILFETVDYFDVLRMLTFLI